MKRHPAFFWWDAWAEGWSTAVRLAETMAAVPVVVNSRLPMIDAAIRNPAAGNYVELYTMVSEKMEAAMLGAASIARDWQAIQSEMLRPHRSAGAAAAASMRVGQLAMGAGGRAIGPVHARATANARRLKGR